MFISKLFIWHLAKVHNMFNELFRDLLPSPVAASWDIEIP
jgi:hypothetical protein